MPQRRARITPSVVDSSLVQALAAARSALDAPTAFSTEALEEAAGARPAAPGLDLRAVPFVTLDPVGSTDLDQAFHLERRSSGYLVRYAIADVPGFVSPGGAVDLEARQRGQTIYAADGRIPLHPPVLSEDRASLLPDAERPALVWTFDLDESGEVTATRLERALVRSRAQLDYASAQRAIDAGAESPAQLLPEIGALRIALEEARGGASLNLPDEEIVRREDGSYDIERRRPLPVEEWNAQLSLMTGMAAAEIMLHAGVGILRTMPQPDDEAFASFRRQTAALGMPWRTGRYGEYLRGLDRDDPKALAVLQAASSLFRGAGYVAFDGEPPAQSVQAALAAPYAHATAPLRRLVDRWVLTICLAVSEGTEPPVWARESLAELPSLMQESGRRASRLASATVNAVEAALLTPLIGRRVDAAVIALRDGGKATLQIADPAVEASGRIPAGAAPGDLISVLVQDADIATGTIELVP